MKAPEHIYIFDNPLIDFTKLSQRQSETDIEYTRTDIFIEKACEWLKDNIYHRVYECGDRLGFPTANFIGDFKKYMEGDKV